MTAHFMRRTPWRRAVEGDFFVQGLRGLWYPFEQVVIGTACEGRTDLEAISRIFDRFTTVSQPETVRIAS